MILDVDSICSKMEPELVNFIHNIILLIKIAVPIIIVIFGMLDFAKGVMASKEDEIKKGQHTFIQRLIAGVVVFLMISISQLVISIVDKDSDGEIWKCANAIMNGDNQYIKEEEREYNKIDDYCCTDAGGYLDDKNVCRDMNSQQYSACTTQKRHDEESELYEKRKYCCEKQAHGEYSKGTCSYPSRYSNAYTECLKK